MYDWIAKKRRGATPIEDEVTSCVFGPLRFMEPRQAWASCLMLFDIQDSASDLEPDRICIRFWPKFFRNDGRGSYVEPDVHILAWRNGELIATILVEIKWGAALGFDQLLDQWRFMEAGRYVPEVLRSRSWHVLLSDRPTRDTACIENQRARADDEDIPWENRLIVRAWHQVANQLSEWVRCPETLTSWRRDLIDFLSAVGVVPFDGFERNGIALVGAVTWQVDKYELPALMRINRVNWVFDEGTAA